MEKDVERRTAKELFLTYGAQAWSFTEGQMFELGDCKRVVGRRIKCKIMNSRILRCVHKPELSI